MPKPARSQNNSLWLSLLGVAGLIIFCFLALFFLVYKPNQMVANQTKKSGIFSPKNPPTNEMISQEEALKIENQRTTEYFVSDILPYLEELNTKISASQITHVYPFTLKAEEANNQRGWLLEITSGEEKSYYLVSFLYQVKLDHPMTSATGDDANCTLSEVKFIQDNRGGSGFGDRNGYVVLSGRDCVAYGGGEFVSIFKMSDGGKVALKGTFLRPGTRYPGVSPVGNAQGRLKGVYGLSNPTLVVEYGSFNSAASPLEEVQLTAYFDLQTGHLKQTVKFE